MRDAPAIHPFGKAALVIVATIGAWLVAAGCVVAEPAADGKPSADQNPAPPAPLDGKDGRPLALENFRPRPMLKVAEHSLTRAKFPSVDTHVHPHVRLHDSPEALAEFVRVMDAQNIAVAVSLDGGLGERLDEHLAYVWKDFKDRFVVFAHIDWRGSGAEKEPATWDCHRPEFARRVAMLIREARDKGVSGLKIFKELGLGVRNPDGSLAAIDDERWDPIWEACGELGLPVVIHTADPAAFFEPIDATNERYEELSRRPEWSFHGPGWPTKGSLLEARNRVIERHPKTIFIAAHFGNDAEDLQQAGAWLERYPNMHLDIAARIAELGRQPYSARRFLIQWADRILFATDGPRAPERLVYHWRFLETMDEYFPYAENPFPPQGLWRIYGIGLPDEALRKIYYENACRLIPGVQERREKHLERLGKGE